MYKEIVGITKSYLDLRIKDLTRALNTLKGLNLNDNSAYTSINYAVEELKKVRDEMLNACDYGKWLEAHMEVEEC